MGAATFYRVNETMIPIRDSVKSQTFPLVNSAMIAINSLAFFYELSLGEQLNQFFQVYGLVPAHFVDDLVQFNLTGALIPIFTSIFMHGGWMHFIGNMWFLYIFGDNVEDSMGHGRYLFFYLLTGVGASLAHVFFNVSSEVPTIGASGAIAGVMGAYMVLHPRGRIVTLVPIFFIFFVNVPAVVFLLIWIGLQTLQGVTALGANVTGGVAWWAHIGGFALGAILIFLFRKPHRQFPGLKDDFI